MQAALYNEIDYQKNDSTNYEMVYPFYSFDDRYNRADKAFVKAENYCVPASSWKGALQLERTVETMETEIDESEKKNSNIGKHFFCKDIMVKSDQIELRNLQKYQYLYQKEKGTKEPKLEVFFPRVGVEMLKANANLVGEILVKGLEVNWQKTCQNLNELARIKLSNNIEEIDRIEKTYIKKEKDAVAKKLERNYKEKLKELLEVRENLKKIESGIGNLNVSGSSKAYIFLGGFKGLLHSLSREVKYDKFDSTSFFIDKGTKMLYGLVIIEIKEKMS